LKRSDQTVGVTVTPRAEPGRRATVGVIAAYSAELGEVRPGSPFAKAGLQQGDTLVKAGGKDVSEMSSVLNAVLSADGKPVDVEYNRGGQILKTNLAADKVKYASMGVALQSRKVKMRFGFVESVSRGFTKTKDIIYLTFLFMKKLAFGEESTKGVAGPVGIFHSSYLMAEEGAGNFLFWLALITVNLGIFNLLVPVPILDGGHIVFLMIEKIRGKPVSDTVMIYSQYAGLVLLLGLVIFVTGNDIMRLFR
jgi:regulator of sigma E protease